MPAHPRSAWRRRYLTLRSCRCRNSVEALNKRIEVVHGDRTHPGEPFVIRIHAEAGFIGMPHTHPSWALGWRTSRSRRRSSKHLATRAGAAQVFRVRWRLLPAGNRPTARKRRSNTLMSLTARPFAQTGEVFRKALMGASDPVVEIRSRWPDRLPDHARLSGPFIVSPFRVHASGSAGVYLEMIVRQETSLGRHTLRRGAKTRGALFWTRSGAHECGMRWGGGIAILGV